MTHPMSKALEYSQDHRQQFVERLGEWLTIPSVSTQTDHRADMERSAAWIADYLRALGLANVQIHPPESHPIVYAEKRDAGSQVPTVLLYGPYDVQPAEPFDLVGQRAIPADRPGRRPYSPPTRWRRSRWVWFPIRTRRRSRDSSRHSWTSTRRRPCAGSSMRSPTSRRPSASAIPPGSRR